MIKKIQRNEYLRRYENMSAVARQKFIGRVEWWLGTDGQMLKVLAQQSESRLQNVLQASVSWNDAECDAFEKGAVLLSALMASGDTWLPELLYVKSARRAIKRMTDSLSSLPATRKEGSDDTRQPLTIEEPAEETWKGTQTVDNGSKNAAAQPSHTRNERKDGEPTPTLPKGVSERNEVTGVPVRPKHIDQYVHLLPKKTQERAAQVRELLRDLDVARENARKLMDAGEQGDKVAQWAKKATSLDDKVRSIYKELDAEWEKLVKSGRIEVDVFGNARVTPSPALPEGRENISLTSEQKHRRRELRKWLIDTRRGAEGKAREKRIEQWKVNIKEYLTLEPIGAALKDEKIVAAAKHYGIEIKSE